jgi:putative nucleotidyltransferase with HDIG domain
MITTPIKTLAQGVSELSSGEFKAELRVSANDELGELSRSFNRMAGLIIEQKASLQTYALELEDSYVTTVKVLAAAIDARDPYTLGHSERVAKMSVRVGQILKLTKDELKDLELACLFHDVGKIRTPDHILQKQARLNKEEERLIQRHPEEGAEILRIVESLHDLVPAVLHHHEWYNGEGYPKGLKGERIPLLASIIAIADSYDAMTSSRPYRKARPPELALNELRAHRGIQFHPQLTDLFVEIMERDGAEGAEPIGQVAS